MEKFTEATWRNDFREHFDYQEDSEYMPDGPKWVEIEAYIQTLIDKSRRNRTKEIIERLELLYQCETKSLKKGIKDLRRTYGYYDDLIEFARKKLKK